MESRGFYDCFVPRRFLTLPLRRLRFNNLHPRFFLSFLFITVTFWELCKPGLAYVGSVLAASVVS